MARDEGSPGRAAAAVHQAAMYYHSRVAGGRGRYLTLCHGSLPVAELDPLVLREAWRRVCLRHECMRARLDPADPRGLVVVVDDETLPPLLVAATDGPSDAVACLDEIRRGELQRGLDPVVEPPHRLTVIPARDGPPAFVWLSHHCFFDGGSRRVVWQELLQLYAALRDGRPAELPPAPSWRAYAAWRNRPAAPEDVAFWRNALAGVEAATATPLAGAVGEGAGQRGGSPVAAVASSVVVNPGSALARALRRLGEAHGISPTTIVHGAWALVLGRHGNVRDVLFGAVRSCRRSGGDEVARLVGPVVNTVPRRIRWRDDEPLLPWLCALQEDWVALRPFETVPLDVVLGLLALPQGEPAFDTAVVAEPDMASYRVEGATHHPLLVRVTLGETVGCRLEYDPTRIEEAAAGRLGLQLGGVLARMVAEPEGQLGRVEVLPEGERETLEAWGGCEAPAGEPVSVHDAVLSAAQAWPERQAVVWSGGSLSYGELVGRACSLARRLHAAGLHPGEPVALWGRRGDPWPVVGFLGILGAGGVCVPLEPDHPDERLRLIVAEVGARFVVGSPDARLTGLEVVDEASSAPGAAEGWPVRVGPGEPAYIDYTTGTTGRPKGVVMHHRGLATLCRWNCLDPVLGGPLTTLQRASWSFDVAQQELFATLLGGGTLVLADALDVRDPLRLWELLRRRGVQRVFLTPVLLHELAVASRGCPAAADLRVLVTAGEQLRVTDEVRRLALRHPGLVFVNQYGTTEVHVVTQEVLAGDPALWPRFPSLGRPVGGAVIRVADGGLRPSPLGAVGEVLVGGPQVACGYWKGPGETGARFVEVDEGPGGPRLYYRTGDRARWLDDGRLQYLGRVDSQLKIRGVRVEPAEVERALEAHPDVRRAVVAGRRLGSETVLVAWVDVPSGPAAWGAVLRAFLLERLPPQLVPRVVVPCELPLAANGKVDMGALPDPVVSARSPVREARPLTGTEEAVARIWRELLPLAPAGPDESFLALGGDSLDLMRLLGRLSGLAGRPLALEDVTRRATVAGMAALVDESPAPALVDSRGGSRSLPPGLRLEEGQPRDLRVDGVALSYLPDWLPERTGLPPDDLRRLFFGGTKPFVSRVLATSHGRIAVVTVPRFGFELFACAAELGALVAEVRLLARDWGAGALSLAGMIPSVLSLCTGLSTGDGDGLPLLTTGHATTVAAVHLAVRQAAKLTGRDRGLESVAFLGLGSIGSSALRLLLALGPAPSSVVLCDLPGRRGELDALAAELREGRDGPEAVTVAPFLDAVPEAVYASRFIVGAASGGRILDVERLRPGTVVVDDSGPPCFDPEAAWRRMQGPGDVLLAEAGLLATPAAYEQTSHLPAEVTSLLDEDDLLRLTWYGDSAITGCILSSLLTARFGGRPTRGLPEVEDMRHWLSLLAELGYGAAPPRLGLRGVDVAALANPGGGRP